MNITSDCNVTVSINIASKCLIPVTPKVPAIVVLPEAATTLNLLVLTLRLPVISVTPPMTALPVVDCNSIFVVPEPLFSCRVLDTLQNDVIVKARMLLARNHHQHQKTTDNIVTNTNTTSNYKVTSRREVELVLVVNLRLPAVIPEAVPVKTSEVFGSMKESKTTFNQPDQYS